VFFFARKDTDSVEKYLYVAVDHSHKSLEPYREGNPVAILVRISSEISQKY
jgi:hypothetical protein